MNNKELIWKRENMKKFAILKYLLMQQHDCDLKQKLLVSHRIIPTCANVSFVALVLIFTRGQ